MPKTLALRYRQARKLADDPRAPMEARRIAYNEAVKALSEIAFADWPKA